MTRHLEGVAGRLRRLVWPRPKVPGPVHPGPAPAPYLPPPVSIPSVQSAWSSHTLWLADPTAAPVELLEPLRGLGFTHVCLRATQGAVMLPRVEEHEARYRQHGWQVVFWGRVDQEHDADVRADPVAAAAAARSVGHPFAHNVEIRWDTLNDHDRYVTGTTMTDDALCVEYGGPAPTSASVLYRAKGCRVALVQTFSATEPWGVNYGNARIWGHGLGFDISIPMVGVYQGSDGRHPDARAQASSLGPGTPRHAYLAESALSGQYDWAALMAHRMF